MEVPQFSSSTKWVLRCGERQYLGANCGNSTGAVLGHGVRRLRVLAHRQGRRCASDQQTGSASILTPGFNLDARTQFDHLKLAT